MLMYTIGGGLKTSLHSFSVVVVFFVGAMCGIDSRARKCLLCSGKREDWLLLPVLLCIGGGGCLVAILGKKDTHGETIGIILQLSPGVIAALCSASKSLRENKLVRHAKHEDQRRS